VPHESWSVFEAQVVDAEVNERETEAAERAEADGALQCSLVLCDFFLELYETAGLSVAEQHFHLGFQNSEISEYKFFEFSHKESLTNHREH
jgi:hypothetical protein